MGGKTKNKGFVCILQALKVLGLHSSCPGASPQLGGMQCPHLTANNIQRTPRKYQGPLPVMEPKAVLGLAVSSE